MIDNKWFADYFNLYNNSFSGESLFEKLLLLKNKMIDVNDRGKKVMIAGNGGSAAMASHCSVDLSKNAGIRSVNFNEADLITCLSNDFGYEQWIAKSIEMYGDKNDMIILISSSGKSENMVNAAAVAKERDVFVVTFTGFDENNPLKTAGDLNFWLDSRAYNIVEMTHQIWLLAVCDSIIGQAEYPAS